MGILDLMLGTSGPGEQGVEGSSYKLPKETHEFVYPVAVRRSTLAALERLHGAESAEPPLEGGTDDLQAAVDDLLGEGAVDASALTERTERTRTAVGSLLESWDDRLDGELGVVYVRSTDYDDLAGYVAVCRRRAEREDDPFALPDGMDEVVALLSRIDAATDGQYRAVVHTDLLPPSS